MSGRSNSLAATSTLEIARSSAPSLSPREALRQHWPEYLIEASLLGAFMVSACGFGVLYQNPTSPVREAIESEFVRRVLMGVSMGLTAIALFYSPWGKQSGAHINPAVTLTFFRLGKIRTWDFVFYVIAQFAGGLCGVLLMSRLLGTRLAHSSVRYVTTVPGPGGPIVALTAEFAIAFVLMTMVLHVSNDQRLSRYTGLFASVLVCLYISFESPLSGMSMNPARTAGAAIPSGIWTGFWVYLVAPVSAMLAAAQLFVWHSGRLAVKCCKFHHQNNKRCIFCGANGGFRA